MSLEKIHQWLKANNIKINTDKSCYISFFYRLLTGIIPIPFGDDSIHQADSPKFFGLTLEKQLYYRKQVFNMKTNFFKILGIIPKLKSILPSYILSTLHNTLILPYLTYCIESWNVAPDYLSDSIYFPQKKSFEPFTTCHTNSIPTNISKTTTYSNSKIYTNQAYAFFFCLNFYLQVEYILSRADWSLMHKLITITHAIRTIIPIQATPKLLHNLHSFIKK